MRVGTMRLVGDLVRSVSRFAIVGLVGGLASACSSETMRFSDTPFSNPFSSADAEPAPSATAEAPAARMKPGAVQSAPLAPPSARTATAAPGYNRPAPAASQPRTAVAGGPGGWSAEGGTAITVGSGDTLTGISDRYGVPGKAILAANGMNAAQVKPGARVMIPVYNSSGQATVAASRPVPAPTRMAAAPARPVDTAEARRAPEPAARGATARAPQPAAVPPRSVQAPVSKVAAAKPEPKPENSKTKLAKAEPAPAASKTPAKVEVAKAEPAKPAKTEAAKPAKSEAAAVASKPASKPEPVKVADAPKGREPEATGALPAQPAANSADFRWPARGRVISAFGGTGSNEGINIAVPDGTPVKAAEAGTVAYAGSEVKGYGNLVLIRHDNGYVSAYAHNGDIEVKRGQKVGRGQTIAKSGQSGNVTSPQIHFEIRKGSTPVDPMQYLASN